MTVDAENTADQRAGEGFGTTSRKKMALLYGVLTAAALVVLQLMIAAGRHLHGPKAAKGAASGQTTDEIFWRLLLAAIELADYRTKSQPVTGWLDKFVP